MASNNLVQVQTYNDSNLGLLLNRYAFMNIGNYKFENFETIEKNLGSTILMDLPPRFTSTGSLVISVQAANQRQAALSVIGQASVAYEFSAQEFIFNVRDYMQKYGRSAMSELGNKIEIDIAGVCETAPYRFFGDGVTPLTNFQQLALAVAFFEDYGAAVDNKKCVLDNISPNRIVNSGLNQFTPMRNDRMAFTWEIGEFSETEWYKSNLLPIHTAGTEGNKDSTLTVVSTTLDSNGAVIGITFSGTYAANDPNSVLQYDNFVFNDGVSGVSNIRFLTFIGHAPSQSPVQFQAVASAASNGSNQVTVSITPPLQAPGGATQNITTPIVAGMQCSVLPTHRCAIMMSGDPLFIAMPRLPDEDPYTTARSTDPETGVSLRTYYGSIFGQNKRAMVHDCIWGKLLIPEYCMKMVIPYNG